MCFHIVEVALQLIVHLRNREGHTSHQTDVVARSQVVQTAQLIRIEMAPRIRTVPHQATDDVAIPRFASFEQRVIKMSLLTRTYLIRRVLSLINVVKHNFAADADFGVQRVELDDLAFVIL